MTYPENPSTGLDVWHPAVVGTWPEEALGVLAYILNLVEETLQWPSQAALNMVFLIKPNGDDRSIGIATFLFRL